VDDISARQAQNMARGRGPWRALGIQVPRPG
jgi:hypothetical protein